MESDLNVHVLPVMEMIVEEEPFDSEPNGGCDVVEVGREAVLFVVTEVHEPIESEEKEHGHVLSVAQVNEVTSLVPRHQLT